LPHVNIELPEELKQQLVDVNTTQFVLNALNSQVAQEPFVLSQPYKIDNGLPYGCLKNGLKPSYKEWNKTQRNMVVTNPNLSVVIDPNISSNISERENRLQNLKNKIKEKQTIISNNTNTNIITTEQGNPVVFEENTSLEAPKIVNETINNSETVEPYKQILKRTIRKKYTLGKTKNNRTVGILIKDRNTRKQVLTAQRELKKKSVNDIKTYLKDHNLIKVGSNAPNDVLRKMYEASMLAGEITNSNSDTLLHNLLKDDKEL
jgi:anion-transporting  ArsA/GET3 family ATPase